MECKLAAVLLATIVAVCYCEKPPVAGGLSDADTNDDVIQRMANFAVSEMGTEYGLVEVTKAQTQVVAGLMYHLKVTVNRISQTDNSSKNYDCKVKVLTQNWLGVIQLTEFHCRNAA